MDLVLTTISTHQRVVSLLLDDLFKWMPSVKARVSVSAQRHCVHRGVQHGFPMVVAEHLTGTLFPARQVEVLDGVEPTTACLQNRCSAIELQYRKDYLVPLQKGDSRLTPSRLVCTSVLGS